MQPVSDRQQLPEPKHHLSDAAQSQQRFQPYQQDYEGQQEAEPGFFLDMQQSGYSGGFGFPTVWGETYEAESSGTHHINGSVKEGLDPLASMPQALSHTLDSAAKSPVIQGTLPYCTPSPMLSPVPKVAAMDEPDRRNLTSNTNKFNVTLKMCGELDVHYQSLQQSQKLVDNKHDILTAIESACSSALSTVDLSDASTCSSEALVMVAILKVLDLCQSLVLHLTQHTKVRRVNELDHLFFLKRIDIALLQARIFLTYGSNMAAAEKAVQIHQSLASTLKQQFEPWNW